MKSFFSPFTLRIVTVLYFLFIITAAILPTKAETSGLDSSFIFSLRLDYLIHLILFIPFMALIHYTFKISFRTKIQTALIWILISLTFSWFTEAIQLLVPYRSFNINDLVANSLGVLLGSLFFHLPIKKNKTLS